MSGPSSPRLPILVNTNTNDRVPLDAGVVTIGRAPENSIVLADDGYISADHAKVYWENGWWIEDVNSSNGTYVNDELLTSRRQLAPNDLIKIGKTTFRIE